MTNLEMTKLCAEALTGSKPICGSLTPNGEIFVWLDSGDGYDPLHDDAQAMALVKKLAMTIDRPDDDGDWGATYYDAEGNNPVCSCRKDLNLAIVECAAKTQAAK